jgi:hypothetical protein
MESSVGAFEWLGILGTRKLRGQNERESRQYP